MTKNKLKLNLFKHKGYWYHGKSREANSMTLFKKIIKQDDIVIEVGGHIGFITQYFSQLVGPKGKVIVFEPGSNNLPYIKTNIKVLSNVLLEEKAVGKEDGFITFYEEGLTGQNNSVVKNFDGLITNKNLANVSYDYIQRDVKLISLDQYLDQFERLDFIKIDIEGGEWDALQGFNKMIFLLKPVIMVEVQTERQEILKFFKDMDYILFNPNMYQIDNTKDLNKNIFCFHKEKHADLMSCIRIKPIN
ncbi:FkbM family methyltransferase [Gammaproteobacteria bacterium]|nr:FkbM family methyltransferase [Gammaproteobacteria bacterium]